MALTVLQVGYPLAEVGPDATGGAEQVLARCDRAVVEAGHRSLVVAPEGSEVAGRLIPLPPVPEVLDDPVVSGARAACRDAVRRVLARTPVDVVHMHGVDFWACLPPPGPPTLVTLHLPPSFYPPGTLPPRRPDTWLCAVSRRHRATFAPDLPLLRVDNGVDLDRYHPDALVDDHVLGLGRICPEKGWELAVDAAREAGLPLVLAGRLYGYEAHRAWFDEVLRPRLDDSRRFIGPVGGERKRELLARARCVVVPSQVPETSSLVALEALACGTPVVAWDTGNLPELVEHGVTGLLVDSLPALVQALRDVARIDRRQCRQAAERRCARQAAARYVSAYQALALARRPSVTRPLVARVEVVDDLERLIALPWSALQDRSRGSVFLRRGWLLPWARVSRPELRVLALWRGDRLDGLLPLQLQGGDLQPLGAPISDRAGALLARDSQDGAHLLQAATGLEGWRSLTLSCLPPDDPLLHAPVAARLAEESQVHEVSPTLLLPPDDPWRHVPKRTRANLRTARNRLARDHRARWFLADPLDLDLRLDELLALHQARWVPRGEAGVLDDARVQAHLRLAAHYLCAEGRLRLHVLHVDDRPAAALLGFQHQCVFSYYIGGFDPCFGALSPGALVIARALEQAAREGAAVFDFLRGSEPYKARWGAAEQALHRRIIRS